MEDRSKKSTSVDVIANMSRRDTCSSPACKCGFPLPCSGEYKDLAFRQSLEAEEMMQGRFLGEAKDFNCAFRQQ